MKLLEIILRELGSGKTAADALEISKSTLSGWINEEKRHPCNHFLNRILCLARELDPAGTRMILDDELRSFAVEISSFVRRGANSRIDESQTINYSPMNSF